MPRLSARALAQLPRLSDTWFIATVQLRTWIALPNEEPHRPHLILIVSADQGTVRGSNIVPKPPTLRQVWDTLRQAMQHPVPNSGRHGVPQIIVMADSALAGGIMPYFANAQLEIDVYEQPLPAEVNEIIRDLENQLRGDKPEHPGLLSVPGVTPELLRGFYAAAAEYYRAAPWVHLNNYQIIALRHPMEKDYRYAMSMGQGGVEYGLATYLRWSDVVRQFTEDENPMTMLPEGGLHSLFFDNVTKVPFDDLAAIQEYGFEIASPEAYPIPIIAEGPEQMRRPSREDLVWYEAALRAIPILMRDYLKSSGRGDYEPIETTLDVPTHTGTFSVVVKYPAGEIPLAAQPAQRLDWAASDDEELLAFDHRVMEGPMQELARQIGAEERWSDPDLARAQELMYRAFETTNPGKRIAFAHDALAISPNCADAYVLLAQEEADTLQRALEYYEQGVAAGERALGKEFFEENTGHFWGILETRPYMRARQGLADALWRLNRKEEARDHFREMLRLNPNDNQGIRELLLALLLEMERDDEARELLKQYPDDWTAVWLYTRALLEFRHAERSASASANKSLADALEENPHVPAYLTGRKRIPNRLPSLVGWGEESEAIAYASDHLNHWRRTPGAIEWLSETKMPEPKTRRRKRIR